MLQIDSQGLPFRPSTHPRGGRDCPVHCVAAQSPARLTRGSSALILHTQCTIDAPLQMDLTRAPVRTVRHGGRDAADRPLLHQP